MKSVRLDEEQRAFVDAPSDSHLALKAGAGSGKTEVLVHRIRRLRAQGKSVLVFSHANRTVDEIKDRLKKAEVAGVTVLTMHKYCIQRMRQEHLVVPDCPDSTIEEAADAFEQGTLWTFEDIVVVDEAQDLSTGQMRIVRALLRHPANEAVRVTMVGDLEQSIYSFQGSDPSHFHDFEALIPEESRFQIRTNYRSSNSLVVEAANALAADDVAQGSAVSMLARPGALPERSLQIIGCDARRDRDAVHEVLINRILQVRTDPGTLGDSIMILAHDNTRLDRAYNVCMRRGLASVLYSSRRSGEYRRTPERLKRNHVLQFLTIHGIKGGEADHVILISGEDRRDYAELDQELSSSESRRVLYVALTRAVKSFTSLFEIRGPCSQPCRWLSNAWSFFETFNAERYRSAPELPERARSPYISLTDLLSKGGANGLKTCLRGGSATGDSLVDQRLYHSSVIDLETSEGAGEKIRKQAKKAYGMGLEMFMGAQFENHTALALASSSLKHRALQLLDVISRLHVNGTIWRAFVGVDDYGKVTESTIARREAFLRWWSARAGYYFSHIYVSLETSDDGGLWPGIFEGLPKELHIHLASAIRWADLKFRHVPQLKEHWKKRVAREKTRFERDGGAYQSPCFSSFFRPSNDNLDKPSHTYMNENIRKVVSKCFEASEKISTGSTSAYDLCLFSALDCCSRDLKATDPDLASSGAQWQAILHLSQRENNAVYLRVEDLMLDAKASRQIQDDASEVCRLLGRPQCMHESSQVHFSCRCDYGDADLTSEGIVTGVCDYKFDDSILEVKATVMGITAEHAAQVLWYSCAAGSKRAYLWDVYHRRLLVWEKLPVANTLFSLCIFEYLRKNPPPSCTHSKVIWPQALRITNECPRSTRRSPLETPPLLYPDPTWGQRAPATERRYSSHLGSRAPSRPSTQAEEGPLTEEEAELSETLVEDLESSSLTTPVIQ